MIARSRSVARRREKISIASTYTTAMAIAIASLHSHTCVVLYAIVLRAAISSWLVTAASV